MHHHLHKDGCTIMYHGQNMVCGHKCTRTGLWMIPLTPWSPTAPTPLSAINPPSIAMATNVNATSSSAKYGQYVHQHLCSPLAAILLNALATSSKLNTILGLTLALICSHLSCSTATNKGHMHQHSSCTALTRNNHADIVLAWAKVDRCAHPTKLARSRTCFALPPLPMPRSA
jgi:hypothetical protein